MLFLLGIGIARDIVLAIDEFQLGPGFLFTFCDVVFTSGKKSTGAGHIDEIRRHTCNRYELCPGRFIQLRHTFQEPHRIGMTRRREEVLCRTGFNNTACIHDIDALGIAGHYTEVVCHNDEGSAELRLPCPSSVPEAVPGW